MSPFIKLFETAESTAYDTLKQLVKDDLGVLKQITFLNKQYHGDDPRLTSKESQMAMASILTSLFYADDRTAFYMGQMEWKANVPVWMRFFDMVGEQPLGSYFGINSQSDLPKFDSTKGSEGAPPSDAPGSLAKAFDDAGTSDPLGDVLGGGAEPSGPPSPGEQPSDTDIDADSFV